MIERERRREKEREISRERKKELVVEPMSVRIIMCMD